MPFIHHGRYRGGNEHIRFSQTAVVEYTEANRSPLFNGRLDASLAALKSANTPRALRKVEPKPVDLDADNGLRAKLLGLSSAHLAKLLRRFGVEGRSKLRNKESRAAALLGTVERLQPEEAEAIFA